MHPESNIMRPALEIPVVDLDGSKGVSVADVEIRLGGAFRVFVAGYAAGDFLEAGFPLRVTTEGIELVPGGVK